MSTATTPPGALVADPNLEYLMSRPESVREYRIDDDARHSGARVPVTAVSQNVKDFVFARVATLRKEALAEMGGITEEQLGAAIKHLHGWKPAVFSDETEKMIISGVEAELTDLAALGSCFSSDGFPRAMNVRKVMISALIMAARENFGINVAEVGGCPKFVSFASKEDEDAADSRVSFLALHSKMLGIHRELAFLKSEIVRLRDQAKRAADTLEAKQQSTDARIPILEAELEMAAKKRDAAFARANSEAAGLDGRTPVVVAPQDL